jgi:hypothetical protein
MSIDNDYSIRNWETLPSVPQEAERKEGEALIGYTPVKINNNNLEKTSTSNGRTFVIYKKNENPTFERYGMRLAGLLSIVTVIPGILLLVNKLFKGAWMDQLINGASTKKYYKKELPQDKSTANKAHQVATAPQQLATVPQLTPSEIRSILGREDHGENRIHLRTSQGAFEQSFSHLYANINDSTPHLPFYVENGLLKAIIYKERNSVEHNGLTIENCEIIEVAKTKEAIEAVVKQFREVSRKSSGSDYQPPNQEK